MNINLLLNGAENEIGVSASPGRSFKDVPILAPLPLRPYVSCQTRNLRHGLCTSHLSPRNRKFSPEEDALMQYMIDSIQSGRVRILSICLKRSPREITTWWDVLDSYEPCPTCSQCQRFQKRIGELRRNYQGSDWEITHYFLNTKIYVAVPPPCFIEKGAKIPLPIVVRLSSRHSTSSLSPYITLNNVRLQWQHFKAKDGETTSFVFSCERFFQSGRLRLCFQSHNRSHHIEFEISCVTKL